MIGVCIGYPIGFLNRGANRVPHRVRTNPPSRPDPNPSVVTAVCGLWVADQVQSVKAVDASDATGLTLKGRSE